MHCRPIQVLAATKTAPKCQPGWSPGSFNQFHYTQAWSSFSVECDVGRVTVMIWFNRKPPPNPPRGGPRGCSLQSV